MILTLFLNLWYLLPFDYFLCCLLRKNYLFFHITRSHSQFYISNLFNHLWLTVILSRFHSFTFYLLRRLPNPGCPYRVAGLGASLVLPPGRPVGTCQQKPYSNKTGIRGPLWEGWGSRGHNSQRLLHTRAGSPRFGRWETKKIKKEELATFLRIWWIPSGNRGNPISKFTLNPNGFLDFTLHYSSQLHYSLHSGDRVTDTLRAL